MFNLDKTCQDVINDILTQQDQNSGDTVLKTNKDDNYLEEIDSLKKNLREKIMEIEELQKEEEDIVREYELRIQNIMNNNNQ